MNLYYGGTSFVTMAWWLLPLVILCEGRQKNDLPHRSEFLVQGLEEIEPAYGLFEGDMYSGLLPMNNKDRNGELMFWLFAPDKPTVTNTITIWLNGGPGCTSFNAGLMFENSPITIPLQPAGYCCVNSNETLTYNEKGAWTKATHMLYVEQPVQVGFSYGNKLPESEADLSDDFFAFLQKFYKVFTEYQNYELFIYGESYAGMYAPSIAHKIYTEMKDYDDNKNNDNNIYIKLGGIGLGNGWVDARVQGPATIDYAYYHGMLDMHTRDMLHNEWDRCFIKGLSVNEPFHEFNVPDDCAISMGVLKAAGKDAFTGFTSGPNMYDVTTWDPYVILAAGDTTIQNFFNNPKVKEILHAPKDTNWLGCMPGAGRRRRLLTKDDDDDNISPYSYIRQLEAALLEHDTPISTLPYIAELLDGGVRVIVYNGDRDMSCCFSGSEQLLNGMEWNGSNEWYNTKRGLWVVNDQPAGYAKSLNGLDFVVVYNSGHLVPFNQPINALDLLTRFLRNESFTDYALPSFDNTDSTTSLKPTTKDNNNNNNNKEKTTAKNNYSIEWVIFAFLFGVGAAYIILQQQQQKRRNDYTQVSEHGINTNGTAGIDEMTGLTTK